MKYLLLLFIFISTYSTAFEAYDLTISKIRAVGDYPGDTYDNTIELWFTTPLAYPSGSACTDKRRVYIDTKHQHIVSAAYLAFASGKKITISVDSNLPIRGETCGITFLDITL